jgi:hypothetical protein
MATLPEDQVPRRKAFEHDHPEWKITAERMGWVWKAQRDGSETLIMANDLRDLLDKLEDEALIRPKCAHPELCLPNDPYASSQAFPSSLPPPLRRRVQNRRLRR